MNQSATISRLRHVGELLYTTTNIYTLAINIGTKRLVEIPKEHLDNCLCQKMKRLTGIHATFDHIYNKCEMASNVNRQIIYKCPYNLSNIIVPVFEGKKLVAALQGGPILTQDPDEYLEKELIPRWKPNKRDISLMREELRSYPVGDTNQLIAISETMAALVHMDQDMILSNDERDAFSKHEQCPNFINSIIGFVTANYAENITLGDAAKYAYVNPSHLSRVFNKEMNCHFRSYLNGIRIEKAKNLLSCSNMSIAEICNQVGFTDQSYFNKIFKQYEHLTPGQYRKKIVMRRA